MGAARRVYILLICAISLQGVTWAVVALLRNLLLNRDAPPTALAFWIAVVCIGLPVFLVHWLWAQRLAGRDEEEREAVLRRLYLYGTMAGLLAPFAHNALKLLRSLLLLATGYQDPRYGYSRWDMPAAPTEIIVECLAAMVILGLLWWYHWRVVAGDARLSPERSGSAAVRRLYVLAFSGMGLVMTTLSVIQLLRWIMSFVGKTPAIGGFSPVFHEVPRIILSLPLWVLFWRWAQQLFSGPGEEERGAVLRKLYLYLVVFLAVIGTVTSATFILHGLLHRWIVPGGGGGGGDGDIRVPLSIILGMAGVWIYHAAVLRRDAHLAGEAPRQASVRRIYFYLVGGVGLGASLAGLAGTINVLISALTEQFTTGLREPLTWFICVLLAGLPVWIVPWRRVQIQATAASPEGAEERRSTARKVYIYFYLFAATVAGLSSLVYIVYRLLSLAFGAQSEGNLLRDLEQSIAYTLLAVGVWLYHGALLRSDRQLATRDQQERLGKLALRVAVVDAGDGHFGRAVLAGLQRRLPGLAVVPIGLTAAAAGAMGVAASPEPAATQLAQADLIVGPWSIAIPGQAEGAVTAEIAQAVIASTASKLLVPFRATGWEWAGLEKKWNEDAIVRQIVRTVERAVEGRTD